MQALWQNNNAEVYNMIWLLLLLFVIVVYMGLMILHLAIKDQALMDKNGKVTFPRKPDISKTIRAVIQSGGKILFV